jgi:phospholipase C
VRERYDEASHGIELTITNLSARIDNVRVFNRYTSRSTSMTLGPGESGTARWSLARTGGWYDVAISVESDSHFETRFAGHMENGQDSISDPLMGGLV